jgi:hypothetical protein
MSRPRNTNWRKDRERRMKAWPKKVAKANAEYDKLHGGARVVRAQESAS